MPDSRQHDHVFNVPAEPTRLTNLERDLRKRLSVLGAVGVLLTGVLMVAAVITPVGATSLLPPNNPPTNVTPSPNFLSSGLCGLTSLVTPCTNPCMRLKGSGANRRAVFPAFSGTQTCTQFVLRALNTARSDEGLPAIVLPTNWYRLRPQEQIFVIVDLERTARGLPPYLGLNRRLHAAAQSAAVRLSDPTYAKGFPVGIDSQGVPGMGGAVSMAYTVLEADYVWMYEDGWGGRASTTPNIACTSAGAKGCWGHRDQLLGSDGSYNAGVGLYCTTCEMGTGFAVVRGTGSFTSLVELPAGSPPTMYFTWAQDVVPFLPASTRN